MYVRRIISKLMVVVGHFISSSYYPIYIALLLYVLDYSSLIKMLTVVLVVVVVVVVVVELI